MLRSINIFVPACVCVSGRPSFQSAYSQNFFRIAPPHGEQIVPQLLICVPRVAVSATLWKHQYCYMVCVSKDISSPRTCVATFGKYFPLKCDLVFSHDLFRRSRRSRDLSVNHPIPWGENQSVPLGEIWARCGIIKEEKQHNDCVVSRLQRWNTCLSFLFFYSKRG